MHNKLEILVGKYGAKRPFKCLKYIVFHVFEEDKLMEKASIKGIRGGLSKTSAYLGPFWTVKTVKYLKCYIKQT